MRNMRQATREDRLHFETYEFVFKAGTGTRIQGDGIVFMFMVHIEMMLQVAARRRL